MENTSANNDLGEWELLNENGLHSCDEYTRFNPTGLFDANYFSILPRSKASSVTAVNYSEEMCQAQEIVKHEIVPPVTVAGSDVVFNLVFEEVEEYESDGKQEFSSEIEQVFNRIDESLVTAYLKQNLHDIRLFEQDCKDSVKLEGRNILTKFGSRWKSTGARALFSVGMAVASMFILIKGGNCQPNKQIKNDLKHNHIAKQTENMGSQEARAKVSFLSCYNKPLL